MVTGDVHVVGKARNKDPPAAKRNQVHGPDTQAPLQTEHSSPEPPTTPGPPMAPLGLQTLPPSCSLVEVLLGSDFFLSVFQKNGECVISCYLSCRETRGARGRLKGCCPPLPTPAVFKEKFTSMPGRLTGGGAKDGEGPLQEEEATSPC